MIKKLLAYLIFTWSLWGPDSAISRLPLIFCTFALKVHISGGGKGSTCSSSISDRTSNWFATSISGVVCVCDSVRALVVLLREG